MTSTFKEQAKAKKALATKRKFAGRHDDEDMLEGGADSGNSHSSQESDGGLQGFTTDDDDSSDDEDRINIEPIDTGKLPTVAKDDMMLRNKLEKAKRVLSEDRGVIYIGRLPHGFFEDQLRGYFSQFGNVTRLRLSRNKKTGKSKHYAFLEFDSLPVAEIVAETMDNYLIMGHILQCKVVPGDRVHPRLWIGANRKWPVIPRVRVAEVTQNKKRTFEEKQKAEKRLLNRQKKRKRKLAEAGIEYELDVVGYKSRARDQ